MRDFHLTPFRGEGFCARCSKLCRKICHKCEDAPSYDGKRQVTYYCSVKCQLLDWPTHHSTCRARQARKKLYRAALFLQTLWYKVRREAFDWELLTMTAWEEELELIAEDRTVFQEEDGRREQIVYQKFPECEDGWVESQLNAALTFGSCQFAVRMLHGPLRKMIDGLYSETEEICFHPQRCKVNVTRVWQTEDLLVEVVENVREPEPLRVVNQDDVEEIDEDDEHNMKDGASLNSSYADTVVRNHAHSGDQNWAVYVHGEGDELLDGNDREQDDDPYGVTTGRDDFPGVQHDCGLPQFDGYYSDEEANGTVIRHYGRSEEDSDQPNGHERGAEHGQDVLGGWVIPGDELVHFNHRIHEANNLPEEEGNTSECERDSNEGGDQQGAQITKKSRIGSGEWLAQRKSLRRSPKKKNFRDQTNSGHEPSDDGDIGLQNAAYCSSEVQLGEKQLLELNDQHGAEEPQEPEHDVLNEGNPEDVEQVVNSQAALDSFHCALKIKMSNGEQWVFDPTAAQFGYSHSLLPLTQYLIRMKAPPTTVTSYPFGTAKEIIEESVAWKNLRKLGRVVTDGTDLGEQEVRRRFQWGQMDTIVEEALSKALGLGKELEKSKAAEQKAKDEKEKAKNGGKLIKTANMKSTNRISTIKNLNKRASKLVAVKPAKEGPDVGIKRLMRAPSSEFDILLQVTLTQVTDLIAIGREEIYTPEARQKRDARVKYWDLFRSFQQRYPTPDIPPPRPYKEIKKECREAIKEIDRQEKVSRKKIKKDIKEIHKQSKKVLREHEKKRKALMKRVEKVARRLEMEDLRREVVENTVVEQARGEGVLDQPYTAEDVFYDTEDEYEPEGADNVEEIGVQDVTLEDMMIDEELEVLEDFVEHLEWVERTGMAGRLDILTPSQSLENHAI